MAEYFRYLRQLLSMQGESFEEELRRLGFSTTRLGPMEVLMSIQHAQLCLGREFSMKEFTEGSVGQHMLPEDFDFEVTKEKLLRERQSSFNKQLDDLAEPLGALFDKTASQYADLPEDSKKLQEDDIINIDTSLLHTESTGEKIIRELQEWLMKTQEATPMAILPEDKIQRILVGACNQLEIATHIEMVASMLRRDTARLMKVALAGTKTGCFVNVIEAAFVGDKGKLDTESKPTEEEEEATEDEELQEQPEGSSSKTNPIATTSTLSKAMKRKAPPTTEPARKMQPKRSGACKLSDATPYFPSMADKKRYHHAGVDEEFFSGRISSAVGKEAGYMCRWSVAMEAKDQIVPDCEVFSTTKAQLSTHIRQMHLGIRLQCYVCKKMVWSGNTWFNHMKTNHTDLVEDDYFVKDLPAEALPGPLVMKTEVSASDI